MSDDKRLPHFEKDKMYHIKVNRAVPLPASEGEMLQPSDHNIVVSGQFADTIKDAIVSATEHNEPMAPQKIDVAKLD